MKNPFQKAVDKWRNKQRIENLKAEGILAHTLPEEPEEEEVPAGPRNRMERRMMGSGYTRRYQNLPIRSRSVVAARRKHFAEHPEDIETDKERWVVYHTSHATEEGE